MPRFHCSTEPLKSNPSGHCGTFLLSVLLVIELSLLRFRLAVFNSFLCVWGRRAYVHLLPYFESMLENQPGGMGPFATPQSCQQLLQDYLPDTKGVPVFWGTCNICIKLLNAYIILPELYSKTLWELIRAHCRLLLRARTVSNAVWPSRYPAVPLALYQTSG